MEGWRDGMEREGIGLVSEARFEERDEGGGRDSADLLL
jgi:hypothetical protein